MKVENTDRFKDKNCKIVFKDNYIYYGVVTYIPTMSSKYNYMKPGWYVGNLRFLMKDVLSIDLDE